MLADRPAPSSAPAHASYPAPAAAAAPSPRATVAVEGLFSPDEAERLRTHLAPVAAEALRRLQRTPGAAPYAAPVLHLHSFRTGHRRYFLAQTVTDRRQVRWARDLDDLIVQAQALLHAGMN